MMQKDIESYEKEMFDNMVNSIIVFVIMVVIIFGSIIAIGVSGILGERVITKRLIKSCSESKICIEQVKTIKDISCDCYTNDKCRETIRRR